MGGMVVPIKKQLGFTLLELIFVVTIIAILAAISIPLYQNLMSKTQVHTAYHAIATLKIPASLKIIRSEDISDASDLGWIAGKSYLFSNDPIVKIDSISGAISLEATLDGKVNPVAKGVMVILSRDVSGHWKCTVKRSDNASWKDSFAPKTCDVI